MPGKLGQKILKTFGIDHPHHPPATQPPPQQPPTDHGARLPGNRVIENDERLLAAIPNGTYARLARMSDGSLLGSFTRFEGNQRLLRVTRSTDGGRTFEPWGEVTRAAGDCDNLFLLEIAPGTVLAAFRNHDMKPGGGFTQFRITVCRSTDGGRNWSYLSQAAEKKPPMGIWEPFMRMGHQGEVQLYYSEEFAPENQCTMLVRSFDGGATWTPPQCLGGERDNYRDGMTSVAVAHDRGREVLVLVFETTTHRAFSIEGMLSYDDGQTWGWRHEVYRSHKSGRHAGSPGIATFADGSLAVVFMTDEDWPNPHWHHNASIKVLFGGPPQDGRIFWTRPTVLCPEASHWPGIQAVDGHTLLGTYECGGAPKAKAITLNMQQEQSG
ncbi:sialidase family protein [Aspergillus candidus]|uniref:Putative BNR/Asp-box repeat protein n=1 Tax=Aspergillus candidus TaxID=41067 RepID=A0A2I2FM93_ASPCN|nr:putative BNR/Asp-box repeat protein [Aspergillus candidus]PLB41741.1 putative BNR/Asp-box repeat protein [Aspergillus candidus]